MRMGFVARYLNIWETPFRHAVREAELTKATQGTVQARPPVLRADGSGFLSTAVLMRSGQKQPWEKRACLA